MTRWTMVVLLAGCLARGQEVQPISVGQSIWRQQLTQREIERPDGTKGQVRADAYGFRLKTATQVRVVLRSHGTLVAVISDPAHLDAKGQPTELTTLRAGEVFAKELPGGEYMVLVAGDVAVAAAYLLTVATPPKAAARLKAVTVEQAAGSKVVGAWQLPSAPKSLALSPDGAQAAFHDGTAAWVADLASGDCYRAGGDVGRLRRVLFSPDGWSLMLVGDTGARLLALPDLVPFLALKPSPGADGKPRPLADAAFCGQEQRVALLPAQGNVILTSPLPDDTATLPNTAGAALDGAGEAGWFALRQGDRRFTVVEADSRKPFGQTTLAATPAAFAVCPAEPAIAVAGPGVSQVWRAVPGAEGWKLPDVRAVAWAQDGRLFGADGQGVAQYLKDVPNRLQPALVADYLALSSGEKPKLLAVSAKGDAILWDLVEPEPSEDEVNLAKAKLSYATGLAAFREGKMVEAHAAFAIARDHLGHLPRKDDLPVVECLCWLRSSQASYMLKEWDRSRTEAVRLVELAKALPAGEERTFYVSMGLYRQADALWEADRRPEAVPIYRASLEAGLTGPAAADARTKAP
ncbi:MAG: hypothetical protein HZB16_05955 [Armatimonadetes bacterium]|nr:hypothetical protein [Armatimonadota bacterium]